MRRLLPNPRHNNTTQPTRYTENSELVTGGIITLKKQAETGGIVITGMGCDKPNFTYWDRILLDASQVTNPSIDPLREPMELKLSSALKPDSLTSRNSTTMLVLQTKLSPQLICETPILFTAMSYGAISFNVHTALLGPPQSSEPT